MSAAIEPKKADHELIMVGADDLPVHCPRPGSPLWNMHPRVYIDISKTGEAACPYCGARYRLKEGEKVHGH
ncbi:zinc-finger domain-containing protein [Alcaligenes ammonioxydans]|jgi:uncharacterized Zn-finger protein|uniref:Zinc-finger domain-containing protein n=1 Tax=Alcaligenes ammonioxydans TaxID=2582914 RepID=A0ABX8SY74_9BURK|nr:zinc-finger domain-containing protein [Alcaligenes ammonioxydans]EJC62201.1 hypothetical protein QWA_10671 [Alcaligenes faecalis subsp. faecalis NCIB 8687]QBH18781.1 zinc-finger domain-containing protein [Alcaligenes faecalis]MCH1880778.1 zinc-finger domain-containing protein [Alcaligenes ammonioxydans]QXX79888.1 zinc-finger domain-containing protein [Alcaligenes ammonioxydans]WGQ34846.1 zinc-finger domain-containing protein [Alcaligenes faecalis]